MEKLFTLLNSIYPLSGELVNELVMRLKFKELEKRDFLLKAGHVCRHICFVEKGLLRGLYQKGGKYVTSWFLKEDDIIISIKSFYGQVESYEAIQALEDCLLYYLSFEELNTLYRLFPEFNFIGRVLTEKYYVLGAHQLYALRMPLAHDRYRWMIEHYPELLLRVPAKFIASYLGIDETTLSRVKGRRNLLANADPDCF